VNVSLLREFYERAGFRVARTANADWYVPGKRVYRSLPVGHALAPAADEIVELTHHSGILGIEFVNASGVGVQSGLWTLRDSSYDWHSLQRQFRQHALRALSCESVHEIGFDDLFRLGMSANLDTLRRQKRQDRHFSDPVLWGRLCDAGKHTKGAGVFAIMRSDGLNAYLVYFIVGDTCHGLFSKSRNHTRNTGSNHALYFMYSRTMIRRTEISMVTTGPQAIPPNVLIDRFKRHAGYQLEPYHFAVLLRPRVSTLLLSAPAGVLIRTGERLFGSSDILQRAHALRYAVRATGG
jgi:hypothetical protein